MVLKMTPFYELSLLGRIVMAEFSIVIAPKVRTDFIPVCRAGRLRCAGVNLLSDIGRSAYARTTTPVGVVSMRRSAGQRKRGRRLRSIFWRPEDKQWNSKCCGRTHSCAAATVGGHAPTPRSHWSHCRVTRSILRVPRSVRTSVSTQTPRQQ